jgi:eukaryotic-like serine/threonine-protein kinase
MHAIIAAEAYTCPKCGERSTKGQLSQTGFHCPRCTLELAHFDLAPNGTVRQVLDWLLAPGDLVQGRYRVTSVLGKRRFAATYLVTDERLQGQRRPLKELPRDLYDEHETALLARLRHPAIPDISDRFEVDGMVYLVLEFGGTQSLEGERKANGGTIAAGQLVPWMHQLCEVLVYLHGKTPPIVHRDLKPKNILLDEDDRIILIDFGIAKESADLAVTHTLARSVSHGFNPPEQVLGTGIDQRSDVYALLTGTVPPAAHERVAGKELPAPRALNPAIPEALDAVILQAFDLNLNRRPQTIAALSRVFTPGTLDARLPDAGLGTRTVRVGAERPLRAPARIPIRTGWVTDAPPGIEPRGRRTLWIIAGGTRLAGAVAAWRLQEPRSPATVTPTLRPRAPRRPPCSGWNRVSFWANAISNEAIRRFLIATFERPISKGAFWERLSRNRLKGILYDLMGRLMSRLSSVTRIGEKLMHQLGVSALYLVDSSSITLWDGVCESYPGTHMHAAIKWHACFDLLLGQITRLSPPWSKR